MFKNKLIKRKKKKKKNDFRFVSSSIISALLMLLHLDCMIPSSSSFFKYYQIKIMLDKIFLCVFFFYFNVLIIKKHLKFNLYLLLFLLLLFFNVDLQLEKLELRLTAICNSLLNLVFFLFSNCIYFSCAYSNCKLFFSVINFSELFASYYFDF